MSPPVSSFDPDEPDPNRPHEFVPMQLARDLRCAVCGLLRHAPMHLRLRPEPDQ